MEQKKPTIKICEKFTAGQVSKHLSISECQCKCKYDDCYFLIMDRKTIYDFEKLRASCGNKPITVNSAHRCQHHNYDKDGVIHSAHMRGAALDLEPPKGIGLHEFEHRARVFFDVVIIYEDDNFIHVHNLLK